MNVETNTVPTRLKQEERIQLKRIKLKKLNKNQNKSHPGLNGNEKQQGKGLRSILTL